MDRHETAQALASQGQLQQCTGERLVEVTRRIREWPVEEIRFSPQAVIEAVVDEFCLAPVTVDPGGVTRSEVEEVGGSGSAGYGQRITLQLPASAEVMLLTFRASTYKDRRYEIFACQRGMDTYVKSTLTRTLLTPEIVAAHVREMLAQLQEHLTWVNIDIARYHEQLRRTVSSEVTARKGRLDQLAEANAALTIPLTATPAASRVTIPVRRRQVRMVDVAAGGGAAEPALTDAVYEDILRILSGFGRAAERLPLPTRWLREEDLRDFLLFIVNSHYEGLARGEVFNHLGKTDILLPYQGRNAFVAECKIWNGPQKLADAVDQLLRYLTWRDTKGALILFIRNRAATDVITRAGKVLREHHAFRLERPAAEADIRQDFQFVSLLDPQRRIQLAMLPIVLPTPSPAGGAATPDDRR